MKKEWRPIEQMWWGMSSSLMLADTPHVFTFFVTKRPKSDLGKFGGRVAGTDRVYMLPILIDCEKEKYKPFEMIVSPKDFRGHTKKTGASFFSPKLSLRDNGNELALVADLPIGDLHLTLRPTKGRVPLFGSPDHDPNSIGYLYPRLTVTGTLNGEPCVTGSAMCEFGWSRIVPMNATHLGGRWLRVQFDDSSELIINIAPWEFRPGIHGLFVDAQGMFQIIKPGDYSLQGGTKTWISPKTGEIHPVEWLFRSEKLKLDIKIDALFSRQESGRRRLKSLWMWSGAGTVTGFRGQHSVKGSAYINVVGRQWWPREVLFSLLSFIYTKK